MYMWTAQAGLCLYTSALWMLKAEHHLCLAVVVERQDIPSNHLWIHFTRKPTLQDADWSKQHWFCWIWNENIEWNDFNIDIFASYPVYAPWVWGNGYAACMDWKEWKRIIPKVSRITIKIVFSTKSSIRHCRMWGVCYCKCLYYGYNHYRKHVVLVYLFTGFQFAFRCPHYTILYHSQIYSCHCQHRVMLALLRHGNKCWSRAIFQCRKRFVRCFKPGYLYCQSLPDTNRNTQNL